MNHGRIPNNAASVNLGFSFWVVPRCFKLQSFTKLFLAINSDIPEKSMPQPQKLAAKPDVTSFMPSKVTSLKNLGIKNRISFSEKGILIFLQGNQEFELDEEHATSRYEFCNRFQDFLSTLVDV